MSSYTVSLPGLRTSSSHPRACFPWHSKRKLLPTQVFGLCLILQTAFPQQQEKLNHIRTSSLFKSSIDFSIILKIEFSLLPGLQYRICWTLQVPLVSPPFHTCFWMSSIMISNIKSLIFPNLGSYKSCSYFLGHPCSLWLLPHMLIYFLRILS